MKIAIAHVRLLWGLVMLLSCVSLASAGEPRVLVQGCQLQQIATQPDIVTPIGMTFDARGRLFVVESHTHMRPDDYEGPEGDRIRVLSAKDSDGKYDDWSTFTEGFQQAMNILSDGPGRLYVVTRRDVQLFVDTDDDGQADEQQTVLRLDSEAEYPHNGLGGIALDKSGLLYIGLGENLGHDYRLVGPDGKALAGSGGVGAIFTCRPDGENLRRLATGIWNPFGICVLDDGRVFCVDNDPHASPPCRLLHIVESGDYGHRWEYSPSGVNPLQAWNGELPGTLPMVAGTGEAPCAVVAHQGYLWVSSWDDHWIARYRLVPKGASYVAEREVVVQGDSMFRPTGMAIAPDGSLWFADWVERSYPVHGQGALWRLQLPEGPPTAQFPPLAEIATKAELAVAREKYPEHPKLGLLSASDLFTRQLGVVAWASQGESVSPTPAEEQDANFRLGILQARRWRNEPVDEGLLREALNDSDANVRLYALRWITDERVTALRDEVAHLLEGEPPSQRYFLTVLSAIDWLDHGPQPDDRSRKVANNLLARELENDQRSPQLHTLVLQLIAPDHSALTLDRLRGHLRSKHAPLRLEAIRTLAAQKNPERFELLAEMVRDTSQTDQLRAEAIVGLATADQFQKLLETFADGDHPVLSREAARVLRLTAKRSPLIEAKPAAEDLASWHQLLTEPGDAASGRRLFFTAAGARCSICHQHSGRGGRIGPDLTRIGVSNSRKQITASILQPSRDIGPRYQPWVLVTDEGKSHVGLRLHELGDRTTEVYVDADGKNFKIPLKSIELRQASDQSIMPSGLEKTLSIDDLRDLVTFLTTHVAE